MAKGWYLTADRQYEADTFILTGTPSPSVRRQMKTMLYACVRRRRSVVGYTFVGKELGLTCRPQLLELKKKLAEQHEHLKKLEEHM